MNKTMDNTFHRIGFHYFPDSDHYRCEDLNIWLPILKQLGTSWLTLTAPFNRSIPEYFINALLAENIEPIIQIQSPKYPFYEFDDLNVLFHAYGQWGVKYLTLNQSPNLRSSWETYLWSQQDLVDRFIDIFQSYALLALQNNLVPVFPPMKPGGDYWDLVFLRASLKNLIRRDQYELLDKMTVGAVGQAVNPVLEWGAGGQTKWSNTRPYYTPENSQDHIGFFIFNWYSHIISQELGTNLPIILFNVGSSLRSEVNYQFTDAQLLEQKLRTLQLYKLSITHSQANSDLRVADEVIACNFWLISAEENSPWTNDTWFTEDGKPKPIAEEVKSLVLETNKAGGNDFIKKKVSTIDGSQPFSSDQPSMINHYLLLPLYKWGPADWELDAIHPFVMQHHPTIGYSIDEAKLAAKVTIYETGVGIDSEIIEEFRANGCELEYLKADGTLVAS